MRWIGLFATFQSLGTLLGTFFPLILYKWLNRQLTLSILIICMGLGTIFEPWATQLWHLYACILVYGVGIGAWNGANNVILIEMWRKRSPSILQFSQFVYGIGTIIGPLLAKNYVIGDMMCPGVDRDMCADSHFNSGLMSNTTIGSENKCTKDCFNYDRRPRLQIPFIIAGLLQMLGPLFMLTMYFLKKYDINIVSEKKRLVTKEHIARHKQYIPTKTIITCISIFLAFGIMSENMYTDFSATFFQYQRTLRLSAEKSAEILSTMSVALSVGRGLSIFVAIYVKSQYMITYQLCIVFTGYICQIIGQDHLYSLWYSAVLICFGYSSIFISLFSFVGQYMEVTDRIGALFIASYNVIYLLLPYYVSHCIETFPQSFLIIEISCLSVAIIAFIVVMICVHKVPQDLIRKL